MVWWAEATQPVPAYIRSRFIPKNFIAHFNDARTLALLPSQVRILGRFVFRFRPQEFWETRAALVGSKFNLFAQKLSIKTAKIKFSAIKLETFLENFRVNT